MQEIGYITNDNVFFSYQPLSYYYDSIKDCEKTIEYFKPILFEIDGLFLRYENNYILPFIHYSNDGKTISNSNYPYLSSVKSLWDLASHYYLNILDVPYKVLSSKLGIEVQSKTKISMIKNRKIIFDGKPFTIDEFKDILQLKSSHIYLISYSDHIRIITKGWGNFYGLSIFGANEMANDGKKYYDILKYYFPKTQLSKYIKELS